MTGQSRDSSFQIFGYPAAALRGEELRSCRAHGLGSDPLTNRFSGPPTMPGSCDMAGGSSGGAWIVGGQYVDGVTSYGYSGNPDRLYSPYFGRRSATSWRSCPALSRRRASPSSAGANDLTLAPLALREGGEAEEFLGRAQQRVGVVGGGVGGAGGDEGGDAAGRRLLRRLARVAAAPVAGSAGGLASPKVTISSPSFL